MCHHLSRRLGNGLNSVCLCRRSRSEVRRWPSPRQEPAVRHAACHRPRQRTHQGINQPITADMDSSANQGHILKLDVNLYSPSAPDQLSGQLHPQHLDLRGRMHSMSGAAPPTRRSEGQFSRHGPVLDLNSDWPLTGCLSVCCRRANTLWWCWRSSSSSPPRSSPPSSSDS